VVMAARILWTHARLRDVFPLGSHRGSVDTLPCMSRCRGEMAGVRRKRLEFSN
jgi:hypothetical protein